MRTDWDKTTTRRPSRNAEITYELVTANARDLAALRTHGCPVGVTGCLPGRVGAMAAVPQMAADLLQRAGRQPWATSGLAP
jgi:hypothetical protein